MKNLDCQAYVTSFNAISRLVPYLVTPEPKRIARFIGGLAPEIKGNVKASRPTTYRFVVDLSLSLTLDAIRNKSVKTSDEGKRKREDESSHRSDKKRKGNYKQKKGSEFQKNSNQSDNRPKCKNCRKRHSGKYTIDPHAKLCGICKTKGHKTLECRELKNATCYNYNEKGHIKTNCPKLAKKPEEAKKTNARVFQMNAREAVRNDNVITGTFLINDIYARVLFDSGADKSFIDNKELLFFVVLVTDEIGRIRYSNKHGLYGLPEQVAMLKASKCMKKGCVTYMAQVTVDVPKPKIEDIPVISEYPGVFPGELPGLLPDRQVEFRIDIIPGAAPVARDPYRLAPTEMKELRTQLDDLLEKGFIQPSSSPWGAPILFKNLNMRQCHWMQTLNDYDYEIRYHPGKANVVADALRRKERIKPIRINAKSIELKNSLNEKLLSAQREALWKKTFQ
ncbi:uncharacterized protein LOC110914246 [Helianthus annuus]|uniref:uncharacterized protein LOC110914246 n=1 Tax=Helianthus annuus TaxID=4232 RepID=UPI000B908B88|nr:uncharacterized protein LOC110914246 [Helianthus annuus]